MSLHNLLIRKFQKLKLNQPQPLILRESRLYMHNLKLQRKLLLLEKNSYMLHQKREKHLKLNLLKLKLNQLKLLLLPRNIQLELKPKSQRSLLQKLHPSKKHLHLQRILKERQLCRLDLLLQRRSLHLEKLSRLLHHKREPLFKSNLLLLKLH